MSLVELTGFEMKADVTPEWWHRQPVESPRQRADLVARVIATIYELSAPWITEVSYRISTNRFTVVGPMPKSENMEALAMRRAGIMRALGALQPGGPSEVKASQRKDAATAMLYIQAAAVHCIPGSASSAAVNIMMERAQALSPVDLMWMPSLDYELTGMVGSRIANAAAILAVFDALRRDARGVL